MKQIAIIGPTASGKSDLALELAAKTGSIILSLDSLAIFKEIDIASAKPEKAALKEILHFGIDCLYPNEHFSVATFFDLYKEAAAYASLQGKNLIIVGGTSFYLKSLLDGLSPMPPISSKTAQIVRAMTLDPKKAGTLLASVDQKTAQRIGCNDRYRLQKALEIFFETGEAPSAYFKRHPKQKILADLAVFEIAVDRETLRERILQRTKKMVTQGLIDEVCYLENRYTRSPGCMKAIGIIETLAYLDGRIRKEELVEQISVHTGQYAKRQQTFNKTQFQERILGSVREINALALESLTGGDPRNQKPLTLT